MKINEIKEKYTKDVYLKSSTFFYEKEDKAGISPLVYFYVMKHPDDNKVYKFDNDTFVIMMCDVGGDIPTMFEYLSKSENFQSIMSENIIDFEEIEWVEL